MTERPTYCLQIVTALMFLIFSVSVADDLIPLPEDIPPIQQDTIQTDTLRTDSDVDTIIVYSADRVESTVSPRVTTLTGNAKISYREMEITAAKIELWWDEHLVKAEGSLDTIKVKVPIEDEPVSPISSPSTGGGEVRGGNEPDHSGSDSTIIHPELTMPEDTSVIVQKEPDEEPGIEPDTTIIPSSGPTELSGQDRVTPPNPRRSMSRRSSTPVESESPAVTGEDLTPPIPAQQHYTLKDSIVWKGLPRMKDGSQVITGERMTYDLRTRRGRVIHGKTGLQDGVYHGDQIKKVDKNVYYICSGYYTTCDHDPPHYSFWSRDVKMMIKDRVIARPLVLNFGPVPVLIFPYGVFSSKGGRQSGLIIPTYGESASQGRYFRNLGYYWAASDYWDVKTNLNFYEEHGVQLYSNLRYTKRYRLNGNISGSFINEQKKWDLRIIHRHTLSPSANLNVNAYFVSDGSYLKDYSLNPDERLRQKIQSNATLSKSWPGTPWSGSVNLSYTEDLATGASSKTIPQISFRGNSPLIPAPEGLEPDDQSWYHKFYYSYSGLALNRQTVTVSSITEDGVTTSTIDSRYRAGIKHDVSLTAQPKPIGYISVTPRFSYTESWYDEWFEYNLMDDGSVDTVKQDGFRARRTFDGRVQMNTKLYGLFYPKVFSIEAIRHTLSPSLGFTYTPDFSEPRWGYYKVFQDTTGLDVYYDEFASNNIFGGTPRREQMSMSISIRNLFEYKRIVDDKEVNGELFSFALNTSHNFIADSLKWANLGSSLQLRPFGGQLGELTGLSLVFSASHSFYELATDPVSGYKRTVNRYTSGGLRLLNFDMTSGFSITGQMLEGDQNDHADNDTTLILRQARDRFDSPVWNPDPVPWSVGVSLRYGENHSDPDNVRKDAWASMKMELQATENWKVSYSTRFDLHNHRVVSGNVSLYRDLHCWEGRLTWNPMGINRGFYLIINIKSPQLRDVKVEKRRGGGGFFGY
ncbi:MAG: putative LPS assembly protein LptD [Candidatus Electryoneaceae bacterium]|nr:putative LPS assembly protein LptD [Candidatus Electryoneaceae bacterium]